MNSYDFTNADLMTVYDNRKLGRERYSIIRARWNICNTYIKRSNVHRLTNLN